MRREDGFTLPEVLVAMTIMMIVMLATLVTLDQFFFNAKKTERQNDAQDLARNSLDQIANRMRNDGAAAADQSIGIDKIGAYDVVFQVTAKTKPAGSANTTNTQRERYCLDSSVPTNEKIWRQTQTWTTAATPAIASTASCPDPAWTTQRVMLDHITNRNGGQNRSVWTANGADAAHTSSMRMQVFVDVDPNQPPTEQPLSTTIAFRNLNQPPIAQFSWTPSANGSIALNASGTYDPENDRVTYTWLDGTDVIGQGLAFTWEDVTPGNHSVTLTATDSAGIAESTTQTVCAIGC
jgi:prepilin-type N-terminal cleavage/methylation domain-containing protein